jgi:hypothetical protein
MKELRALETKNKEANMKIEDSCFFGPISVKELLKGTELEVVLKDKNALDEYQKDEYHCSIVKAHMHKVRESSIAVDYEI